MVHGFILPTAIFLLVSLKILKNCLRISKWVKMTSMTDLDYGSQQTHIQSSLYPFYKDASKLQLNHQKEWKLTCSGYFLIYQLSLDKQ